MIDRIEYRISGFRNTSSQLTASFSQDGKYVICASEDSQVYVWKREEPRNPSSGKKGLIATRGHEHFPCKDVSVAIAWPGMISCEPPLVQMNSKRHSKRAPGQPTSACSSPTRDENSKKQLPPLPKKNNNNTAAEKNNNTAVEKNNSNTAVEKNNNNTAVEKNNNNIAVENNNSSSSNNGTSTSPPDEEPQQQAQVTRSDSRTGESLSPSPSASIRYGDSPSISSAASNNPSSSSWSSSWSWFDVGNNHGHHAVPATAWGLVIVTAGLGGEIRAYQNFGLPRRIGRQTNFWTTT